MRRLKTGWYSGMNVANAPTTTEGGVGWYVFEVIAMNSSAAIYSICVATNPYNRKQYVGFIYDGVWSGWKQIATATPPQKFNLPLSDGYETYASSSGYENVYYKDQEGIVSVEISIRKIDGFKTGSYSAIAQLPEGFRPAFMKHNMAYSYGPYGWSAIFVRPNGTIDVYISNDCTSVFGELHFIAQDQA